MVAGYVSLLYSISEKPLEYWSKQHSQSGRIRKILDSDLLENVIEIQDFEQPHGYGTSILCPSDSSQFLNIELPILVVVIKNLNLHCRLQVQVEDTQKCQHHFQFSNADSEKHNARGLICRARVKLETGWNKLELNLSNLTQSVFKREYAVTQRLQICGNCRLRRVYFIDKHYDDHEICPMLYHKFLDSYMLKWGIRSIERSTQTNLKRNKSKIKGVYNLRNLVKTSSTENLNTVESAPDSGKSSVEYRTTTDNFLKNLQIKTDILINEFLDKQPTKLAKALDLKHNTRLKPYSFPNIIARSKPLNSIGMSEDILKKIGGIGAYVGNFVYNEEKRKDTNTVKVMQDNWKHRYLLPQDESSNNNDLMKQITKRTMLERKPKSLLLLSEVKPNIEKAKASSVQRKSAESTTRNESIMLFN